MPFVDHLVGLVIVDVEIVQVSELENHRVRSEKDDVIELRRIQSTLLRCRCADQFHAERVFDRSVEIILVDRVAGRFRFIVVHSGDALLFGETDFSKLFHPLRELFRVFRSQVKGSLLCGDLAEQFKLGTSVKNAAYLSNQFRIHTFGMEEKNFLKEFLSFGGN